MLWADVFRLDLALNALSIGQNLLVDFLRLYVALVLLFSANMLGWLGYVGKLVEKAPEATGKKKK